MRIKGEHLVRIIAVTAFVVSLQGCDKMKELVGYFSPQHKQQAAAPMMKAPAKQTPPAIQAKTNANTPLAPDELVRVGNWSMTIGEFNNRLELLKKAVPTYDIHNVKQNKQVLEGLIRQQLLVQEAEQTGVAQSKDVVNAIKEFRRTVLVREMATRVVKGVEATEQEAKQYYDQHKSDFSSPAQYKIAEIVVATQAHAKSILAQHYQGATFVSLMQGSKKHKPLPKGQDGYLTLQQMPFPKMAEVVQTLDTGEVSTAFKGPEGFYIIKLTDKKPGEVMAYDKIKHQIQVGLTQLKQQQALLSYLEGLRKKASVQVNEKLLEKAPQGKTGESSQ